ncbi:pilus assembly protein TadG-related protein [Trichococcus collinsii]|nr:pilus assembly protein TadG-related protein [Trichococcus collinsii]
MNWKKRFWSDEKGAALPMVVGMLLLIMAFASLVVDAGVLYADRRQMVTAADAGALAGAQTLEESKGLDVSTAISTAVEYAIKNGADTASAVVATKSVMIQNQTDTRQVITVTVNENQNLFFAKIFGENEAIVTAKAVGTWGYTKSVAGGNILPLFVKEGYFIANQDSLLHAEKQVADDVLNGNWGFLDIPGLNNAAALAGTNSDTPMEISIDVETDPGNIQSLPGNIETRMLKAATIILPDAVEEEKAKKEIMTGLIPIVENTAETKNGKTVVRIKYFVPYQIEDYIVSAGNTNNKKSEGSSNALQFSDDKYVKNNYQIGVATEYEDYAFNNTGEATSLPKGTILGHFSGIPIEFTAIAQPGDQVDPNTGTTTEAVTYHKLIE